MVNFHILTHCLFVFSIPTTWKHGLMLSSMHHCTSLYRPTNITTNANNATVDNDSDSRS